MILVYLIPLAFVVGLLRGGSPKYYLSAPLRLVALPCLSFLMEAFLNPLMRLFPFERAVSLGVLICLEYALLFAFCLSNLKRRSMAWILAGVALNFLVIAHNGFRMPVSEMALTLPALSGIVARIQSGELAEYVIAGVSAPLFFLGDIIYLPFLPGGLASVGDFLLGIGVFRLILEVMRPS